jgi:hypothetical protein
MDIQEQLRLASIYFKNREESTEKCRQKHFRQLVAVVSSSDVFWVLKMIVEGTFVDFYKRKIEIGSTDFEEKTT